MATGWMPAIAALIVFAFNLACYLVKENNRIWKRLGSQKGFPLLISNKKCGTVSTVRPSSWFAWDLLCANDLNVEYEPSGGLFFIYFTNWTFVLFGLTGVVGTLLTAKAWTKQHRMALLVTSSDQPGTTDSPAEWSKKNMFYLLLLETVTAASIMLTIFYWLADYVKGSAVRVDNPLKHGVSSALLLGDLALSRTPLVSYHIQIVIGYGSVYLVFLWLYFAGSGTWVYRTLDWSKPSACTFYFALPLLLILGFVAMFAVVGVRELWLTHCSCFTGGTSSNDTTADTDAAAPVSGKELIKDNGRHPAELQLTVPTVQILKAADNIAHSHEL